VRVASLGLTLCVAQIVIVAACSSPAQAPTGPIVPVGTCVTLDSDRTGFTVAACDGPHSHVVSAWLPNDAQGACPVPNAVRVLHPDGDLCLVPAATPFP
jgi:hypothetical protein